MVVAVAVRERENSSVNFPWRNSYIMAIECEAGQEHSIMPLYGQNGSQKWEDGMKVEYAVHILHSAVLGGIVVVAAAAAAGCDDHR